jgi:ankyrin repeat protein
MALDELKQDIQRLIDNGEYEEAHQGLQFIVTKLDPNSKGSILVWAIKSNNIPMVELLLDHILDPNSKVRNHKYPLDLAIEDRNLDMVRILLYNGANPNLSTFLHKAVRTGDLAIVDELLNYNADPNMKNLHHHMSSERGTTPLFELFDTEEGSDQLLIAKKLIDAGADLTAINNQGDSLLHHYTLTDNYDIVKFLLDLGVDPNVQNKYGETPLVYILRTPSIDFFGSRSLDPNLIKLLITYGADPRIPDQRGRDAFEILRLQEFDNSEELLDILESFEELPIIKEPINY